MSAISRRQLFVTSLSVTFAAQIPAPADIAGRDALIWSVVDDLVRTPGDAPIQSETARS